MSACAALAARVGCSIDLVPAHVNLELVPINSCDALLCSVVLQYVELSIEEVIDRLPQKPYMIFLNKVPVSSKQGFFTVETFVKRLPCHIFGPDYLGRAREHLGYRSSRAGLYRIATLWCSL